MPYNKRKYKKVNDKKVLRKKGKNWITSSISLLKAVGHKGLKSFSNTSRSQDFNPNQNNHSRGYEIHQNDKKNKKEKLANNNASHRTTKEASISLNKNYNHSFFGDGYDLSSDDIAITDSENQEISTSVQHTYTIKNTKDFNNVINSLKNGNSFSSVRLDIENNISINSFDSNLYLNPTIKTLIINGHNHNINLHDTCISIHDGGNLIIENITKLSSSNLYGSFSVGKHGESKTGTIVYNNVNFIGNCLSNTINNTSKSSVHTYIENRVTVKYSKQALNKKQMSGGFKPANLILMPNSQFIGESINGDIIDCSGSYGIMVEHNASMYLIPNCNLDNVDVTAINIDNSTKLALNHNAKIAINPKNKANALKVNRTLSAINGGLIKIHVAGGNDPVKFNSDLIAVNGGQIIVDGQAKHLVTVGKKSYCSFIKGGSLSIIGNPDDTSDNILLDNLGTVGVVAPGNKGIILDQNGGNSQLCKNKINAKMVSLIKDNKEIKRPLSQVDIYSNGNVISRKLNGDLYSTDNPTVDNKVELKSAPIATFASQPKITQYNPNHEISGVNGIRGINRYGYAVAGTIKINRPAYFNANQLIYLKITEDSHLDKGTGKGINTKDGTYTMAIRPKKISSYEIPFLFGLSYLPKQNLKIDVKYATLTNQVQMTYVGNKIVSKEQFIPSHKKPVTYAENIVNASALVPKNLKPYHKVNKHTITINYLSNNGVVDSKQVTSKENADFNIARYDDNSLSGYYIVSNHKNNPQNFGSDANVTINVASADSVASTATNDAFINHQTSLYQNANTQASSAYQSIRQATLDGMNNRSMNSNDTNFKDAYIEGQAAFQAVSANVNNGNTSINNKIYPNTVKRALSATEAGYHANHEANEDYPYASAFNIGYHANVLKRTNNIIDKVPQYISNIANNSCVKKDLIANHEIDNNKHAIKSLASTPILSKDKAIRMASTLMNATSALASVTAFTANVNVLDVQNKINQIHTDISKKFGNIWKSDNDIANEYASATSCSKQMDNLNNDIVSHVNRLSKLSNTASQGVENNSLADFVGDNSTVSNAVNQITIDSNQIVNYSNQTGLLTSLASEYCKYGQGSSANINDVNVIAKATNDVDKVNSYAHQWLHVNSLSDFNHASLVVKNASQAVHMDAKHTNHDKAIHARSEAIMANRINNSMGTDIINNYYSSINRLNESANSNYDKNKYYSNNITKGSGAVTLKNNTSQVNNLLPRITSNKIDAKNIVNQVSGIALTQSQTADLVNNDIKQISNLNSSASSNASLIANITKSNSSLYHEIINRETAKAQLNSVATNINNSASYSNNYSVAYYPNEIGSRIESLSDVAGNLSNSELNNYFSKIAPSASAQAKLTQIGNSNIASAYRHKMNNLSVIKNNIQVASSLANVANVSETSKKVNNINTANHEVKHDDEIINSNAKVASNHLAKLKAIDLKVNKYYQSSISKVFSNTSNHYQSLSTNISTLGNETSYISNDSLLNNNELINSEFYSVDNKLNLARLHQSRANKILQSANGKPVEIKSNSVDDLTLKKADSLIDENASYTVDAFNHSRIADSLAYQTNLIMAQINNQRANLISQSASQLIALNDASTSSAEIGKASSLISRASNQAESDYRSLQLNANYHNEKKMYALNEKAESCLNKIKDIINTLNNHKYGTYNLELIHVIRKLRSYSNQLNHAYQLTTKFGNFINNRYKDGGDRFLYASSVAKTRLSTANSKASLANSLIDEISQRASSANSSHQQDSYAKSANNYLDVVSGCVSNISEQEQNLSVVADDVYQTTTKSESSLADSIRDNMSSLAYYNDSENNFNSMNSNNKSFKSASKLISSASNATDSYYTTIQKGIMSLNSDKDTTNTIDQRFKALSYISNQVGSISSIYNHVSSAHVDVVSNAINDYSSVATYATSRINSVYSKINQINHNNSNKISAVIQQLSSATLDNVHVSKVLNHFKHGDNALANARYSNASDELDVMTQNLNKIENNHHLIDKISHNTDSITNTIRNDSLKAKLNQNNADETGGIASSAISAGKESLAGINMSRVSSYAKAITQMLPDADVAQSLTNIDASFVNSANNEINSTANQIQSEYNDANNIISEAINNQSTSDLSMKFNSITYQTHSMNQEASLASTGIEQNVKAISSQMSSVSSLNVDLASLSSQASASNGITKIATGIADSANIKASNAYKLASDANKSTKSEMKNIKEKSEGVDVNLRIAKSVSNSSSQSADIYKTEQNANSMSENISNVKNNSNTISKANLSIDINRNEMQVAKNNLSNVVNFSYVMHDASEANQDCDTVDAIIGQIDQPSYAVSLISSLASGASSVASVDNQKIRSNFKACIDYNNKANHADDKASSLLNQQNLDQVNVYINKAQNALNQIDDISKDNQFYVNDTSQQNSLARVAKSNITSVSNVIYDTSFSNEMASNISAVIANTSSVGIQVASISTRLNDTKSRIDAISNRVSSLQNANNKHIPNITEVDSILSNASNNASQASKLISKHAKISNSVGKCASLANSYASKGVLQVRYNNNNFAQSAMHNTKSNVSNLIYHGKNAQDNLRNLSNQYTYASDKATYANSLLGAIKSNVVTQLASKAQSVQSSINSDVSQNCKPLSTSIKLLSDAHIITSGDSVETSHAISMINQSMSSINSLVQDKARHHAVSGKNVDYLVAKAISHKNYINGLNNPMLNYNMVTSNDYHYALSMSNQISAKSNMIDSYRNQISSNTNYSKIDSDCSNMKAKNNEISGLCHQITLTNDDAKNNAKSANSLNAVASNGVKQMSDSLSIINSAYSQASYDDVMNKKKESLAEVSMQNSMSASAKHRALAQSIAMSEINNYHLKMSYSITSKSSIANPPINTKLSSASSSISNSSNSVSSSSSVSGSKHIASVASSKSSATKSKTMAKKASNPANHQPYLQLNSFNPEISQIHFSGGQQYFNVVILRPCNIYNSIKFDDKNIVAKLKPSRIVHVKGMMYVDKSKKKSCLLTLKHHYITGNALYVRPTK